jgi:hypothetical protein
MGSRLAGLVLGAFCLCALVLPGSASAQFGPLLSFGSYGEGAGQFESPVGSEYAADGDLYVVDYYNSRVDVFSASGGFLYAFGAEVDSTAGSDICTAASGCKEGERSAAAGGLNRPESVALLGGRAYIADRRNGRVDVFSETGEFEFAFGEKVNVATEGDVCTTASGCRAGGTSGEEASLIAPSGVATINGLIYVIDHGNSRIDVFEPSGKFIGAFGKGVAPNGTGHTCLAALGGCKPGVASSEAGALWEPSAIAAAKLPGGEEVLAVGSHNNRVDLFLASGGEFLRAFGGGVDPSGGNVCTTETGCVAGEPEEAAGDVVEPGALAFDAAGDLFVGDAQLSRVSEFDPATGFVETFGSGVADGADAFQICSVSCRAGNGDAVAGAASDPYGLAFDAHGDLSVSEESSLGGATSARIGVFGELPEVEPGPSGTPVTEPTKTTTGPGTVATTAPSVHGTVKLGKAKVDPKTGTAQLSVTVNGAGKLVVSGKGLKTVSKAVSKAGKVTVTLKATGSAAKGLAKSGKAKVKLTATFTPSGGTAGSATKSLLLKENLG